MDELAARLLSWQGDMPTALKRDLIEAAARINARPTADLGDDGDDMAAMLYQEAGQLDDLARANAIRAAADRLILYREALARIARLSDLEMADGDGAREIADAVLSRSGG